METTAEPRVEPIVSLTSAAADHIKSMQSEQPEHAGKALRVYVEGGGCSGLQYGLVFDESREGDFAAVCFGLNVLVDPVSADYLRGTVIDYSEALTGGGLKISNPKARQSCGCGKSFEA
jgi:iron-sulfur cluster assembly accessory protein